MIKNALLILVASIALAACGGSSKPASTVPPPVEAAEPAADPAAEPAATEPAPPAEPPAPPPIPDPLEAGPDIYKLAFENESVRIFTVTFAKGAKIGMHKHPDHAVYAITGGKLKITPEGGEAQEMDLKAGMAAFLPAQNHSAENVGDSEIKIAVVEVRKPGAAAPEGKEPHKVGPKIYKQVFDNEKVRIYEITFAKGAKIGTHTHPDHAVYILTPGKLSITGADGKAQEMELAADQAAFLPAQAHSAKNAGKTVLKAVVFEIKP